MMYFKLLEKQEKVKPKSSSHKEIIKIKAEINEIETEGVMYRINETKNWFFGKIIKIEKLLAKLTTRKREKTQINKIRDEKGNITTNTNEIQRIRENF
jgi:hypothetical protein